MSHLDLHVEGMTCAACSARIEKVLGRIPGVHADVSLIEHRARITGISIDEAIAVIRRAGYDAWPVKPRHVDIQTTTVMDRFRLGISVGCAILMSADMVAMLSGALHLIPLQFQFVLATLMQTVVAWPFYGAALRALRGGSANMESLVSLGTLAAYAWSLAAWIAPHWLLTTTAPAGHASMPPVYFETSVIVLAMVCIGRHLELRARQRALAAIAVLVKLDDGPVRLWNAELEKFAPAAVASVTPGDRLEFLPGDPISLDALILEGQSEVDESSLTGESLPALRGPGQTIYAGCHNLSGRLVASAICRQENSRRALIGARILDALGTRAPIAALADRIAAIFVPAVLIIAAATFAGHLLVGAAASEALGHAVAVLVVACPCALGLATPSAIAAGLARSAQRGWLFRSADALQRAADVDMVVLDKTGTLTSGRPVVVALSTGRDSSIGLAAQPPDRPWPEWLAAATAAEKGIEHPLAGALLSYAAGRPMPSLENVNVEAGQGIIAMPGEVIVGRPSWVRTKLSSTDSAPDTILDEQQPDASAVDVAMSGIWRGRIWIADSLRPDAPVAIDQFRSAGMDILILSGDRETAVRRVAGQLGNTSFEAAQSPENKTARLEQLRAQGRKVAMIGDGINDASAMAHAHLGVALASGAALALEAADLTISESSPLQASAQSLALARATMGRVRENLIFAFGFNALAIPLAALGMLSPVMAGTAMALSSFLVVSNAARMLRWTPPQPGATT